MSWRHSKYSNSWCLSVPIDKRLIHLCENTFTHEQLLPNHVSLKIAGLGWLHWVIPCTGCIPDSSDVLGWTANGNCYISHATDAKQSGGWTYPYSSVSPQFPVLYYLFFRPLSLFCSGTCSSVVFIPPQTELQLLVHEVDIADTLPVSCNTCPVTYTVLPSVAPIFS